MWTESIWVKDVMNNLKIGFEYIGFNTAAQFLIFFTKDGNGDKQHGKTQTQHEN